jgi:hypothetical protein
VAPSAGTSPAPHCALAGGICYRAALNSIAVLDGHRMISRVEPSGFYGGGKAPHMIGLTAAGNDVLEGELDLDGWPPFALPARCVIWQAKT